jgi:acyl carrier protein
MSDLLRIEPTEHLAVDSSIYGDWGLDSLQTFELIIMTEDLAGLRVPPAEVPPIYLIGDAYDYYLKCIAAAHQLEQEILEACPD